MLRSKKNKKKAKKKKEEKKTNGKKQGYVPLGAQSAHKGPFFVLYFKMCPVVTQTATYFILIFDGYQMSYRQFSKKKTWTYIAKKQTLSRF